MRVNSVNSSNTNIYKPMVLCLILMLVSICSTAYAVNAVARGKSAVAAAPSSAGTLIDMLSGGSASVLESVDIDEAKGKALQMAKDEAMLKVAGLYVAPEILEKNKGNLLRALKPHQNDIIESYKIMSEERGEDGFYRVKISARIRQDAVKNVLMKNLRDDRVIVITGEKNMGHYLERNILEHDLIRRIKHKGYTIVDYRTIRNSRVRRLVSSIMRGNTRSVEKIGIYYLTNVVVVGYVETSFSQQTRDIYSAHATGQVKIHQIGSKKELLSLTRHDVKGFGSDAESAGIDAIRKISSEMSEESIKGLPAKMLRKITIKIREIGNYFSFRKEKKLICSLPYVRHVRVTKRDFDNERAVLTVTTTKGSGYIAQEIAALKAFVIRDIRKHAISLEARKI